MENVHQLLAQVNTFIKGDSFFRYHGLFLGSLWLIGSVIAILARRISPTLHALLFFVIDACTAFFIIGAMLRVYPLWQDRWDEWTLLKKGHFIGGGIFLVLLILQHIGGVTTLLKGVKFNPAHRKLGYYVSNFGRVLATFGFVIAEVEKWIIYTSAAITLILLIASTYKVFFAGKKPERTPVTTKQTADGPASPSRNKSPKRD